MRRLELVLTLLAVGFMIGCENSAPPVANNPPAAPPLATFDPPAPPAPPPMPVVEEPMTEQVVAEQGVGLKGRSLDEYEGVVVTPVKSLFAARERLAFEVSIPHALNLYQATEGRMPKSHEEFMQHIIEANQIQLPQLPEGHRYLWDPERGELMVERPKRAAAP
jgi:hypothetical protein